MFIMIEEGTWRCGAEPSNAEQRLAFARQYSCVSYIVLPTQPSATVLFILSSHEADADAGEHNGRLAQLVRASY